MRKNSLNEGHGFTACGKTHATVAAFKFRQCQTTVAGWSRKTSAAQFADVH
jgi:hypothetical protein